MYRLRILLLRLSNVFRKQHLEQDLNSELQTHLDLVADENIRRGMSPVEARHAARREFGGVEQTKELYRSRRGLTWIDSGREDVRLALRMLLDRKSTRLNSSHRCISYAVFCLKKKKNIFASGNYTAIQCTVRHMMKAMLTVKNLFLALR